MSYRLQVVVSPEERERFRRMAKREGLSVSAWIRRIALKQVETDARVPLRSAAGLENFFRSIDDSDSAPEPDWEVHKAAIEKSRLDGSTPPPP